MITLLTILVNGFFALVWLDIFVDLAMRIFSHHFWRTTPVERFNSRVRNFVFYDWLLYPWTHGL